MDCVNCGLQAGYNRVVVDLVSDQSMGGFCRNCELDLFGRTLTTASNTDDSCILCERDGHYGLPAWTPREQVSGDRVTFAVDFSLTDRTPSLCDEHFHELCTGDDRHSQPARRYHS